MALIGSTLTNEERDKALTTRLGGARTPRTSRGIPQLVNKTPPADGMAGEAPPEPQPAQALPVIKPPTTVNKADTFRRMAQTSPTPTPPPIPTVSFGDQATDRSTRTERNLLNDDSTRLTSNSQQGNTMPTGRTVVGERIDAPQVERGTYGDYTPVEGEAGQVVPGQYAEYRDQRIERQRLQEADPRLKADYEQRLTSEYGAEEGPITYEAPVNEQGKSTYDIQREQIDAEFEREKQRRLQDLTAQLEAQGITGPAAEQMKQEMLTDLNREQATQKQEVTQQELAAAETAAEAERGRRFTREERLGTQAFSAEQSGIDRDLQERITNLDASITNQSMNQDERAMALDAALKREGYGLSERMGNLDAYMEQQGIDQRDRFAALDATLQREGMGLQERLGNLDAMMQTKGLNQKERLALQDALLDREQMAVDQVITRMRGDIERDLTRLSSQMKRKEMELGAQLDVDQTTRQAQADAAYKAGITGQELSQEQLRQMSPLERESYEAGKSGKRYDEYADDRDAQIEYRHALITSLDPDSPLFEQDLAAIMRMFGVEAPQGGTGATREQTIPIEPGTTGREAGRSISIPGREPSSRSRLPGEPPTIRSYDYLGRSSR